VRRLRANILWSLVIGTCVGLLGLEIGLRIHFRDDYGLANYRDWHFKRNWSDRFVERNALGHRDHEFSRAKPAGTFRILALGDALAFGEGVESIDDLYTAILERQLNTSREPRTYEVINVAEIGWEIDDYLAALRDPGLSYAPDLLLLALYINDVEDRRVRRPKPPPLLPERLLGETLHRALLKASFLYWYSVKPYEQHKYEEFWLDFVDGYTRPDSQHWARFVPIYQELLETCRDNDLPVLVVIFPYLVAWDAEHPFAPVYQRMAEIAERGGATALDLLPRLLVHDIWRLRAGVSRWLPSERAHRIVAGEIEQRLWETGLLRDVN